MDGSFRHHRVRSVGSGSGFERSALLTQLPKVILSRNILYEELGSMKFNPSGRISTLNTTAQSYHNANQYAPAGGLPQPYQLCRLGIIDILGDSAILDALDGFIDDEKWNKKPFARLNRVAEAIVNSDL